MLKNFIYGSIWWSLNSFEGPLWADPSWLPSRMGHHAATLRLNPYIQKCLWLSKYKWFLNAFYLLQFYSACNSTPKLLLVHLSKELVTFFGLSSCTPSSGKPPNPPDTLSFSLISGFVVPSMDLIYFNYTISL